MQRSHLVVLLVALGALAAILVWSFGRSVPPVGGPSDPPPQAAASGSTTAPAVTARDDASQARRTAAVVADEVEDDPDIRAALTGFRGRVVDHDLVPVAGCGVRIYRLAMDAVLQVGLDVFADASAMGPDFVAGETTTASDGTFVIDGVWPRAHFVLFAGIGTDAPSHRILQQSPVPGERLDLGDIVLDDSAKAIGTVVDEQGEPIAGALVRAVDLPGQALQFLPLERFDPSGCLFVREPPSAVRVIEMPGWVAAMFEHLPIPAVRSAADGTFKLVGIQPGTNLVATTSTGWIADVRPSVRFEPGEVKDLGEVRLREGEELSVRVVDSGGKPVADAEVVAGSASVVAPVDFARRLGRTDADGRIAALGFAAGKATVAARRSLRDPWVIADPQPVLNDIEVALPGVVALTVRVVYRGVVVPQPELRLVQGNDREQALMLSMVSLLPAVDLSGRTTYRDDGSVVLDGLPAGDYLVMARTAGAAVGAAEVRLSTVPSQVQIELRPGIECVVRVVGPLDVPVRNAAIHVQERGEHADLVPLLAGRTGNAGRLHLDRVRGPEVAVTASHPRWGAVHGSIEPGRGELLLRFAEPGWIEGTLTDGGQPVAVGKYTLTAEWNSDDGPQPALEPPSTMAAVGASGKFTLRALQPGNYWVSAVESMALIRSPGGAMDRMQGMVMADDLPREDVRVAAGAATVLRLDVARQPFAGPVGSVSGSVTVDGRLAEGYRVQAETEGGRHTAVVDAAGRFDLGPVPVGPVGLKLMQDGAASNHRTMWSHELQLADGEHRSVVIALQTSSLRGHAVLPDGTAAAGISVQASGQPIDATGDGDLWMAATTDSEGRFDFTPIPAGVYELAVSDGGERGHRGELRDVRAESGRPVTGLRLQLRMAVSVTGRVDLSACRPTPQWAWIAFHRADPERPADRSAARKVLGCGTEADGAFATWDLAPGTYFATVHVAADGEWSECQVAEPLVVTERGLSDVQLRPVPPLPK